MVAAGLDARQRADFFRVDVDGVGGFGARLGLAGIGDRVDRLARGAQREQQFVLFALDQQGGGPVAQTHGGNTGGRLDDHHIAYHERTARQHYQNLLEGSELVIGVADLETKTGYRVRGKVTLHSDDAIDEEQVKVAERTGTKKPAVVPVLEVTEIDDLTMGAVANSYPMGEAAVLAVVAAQRAGQPVAVPPLVA